MINSRGVVQYDFNFNVIAIYKNAYDVVNSLNITRIYDILKLSDRKAYGYFWSFSDVDVMHEKRTILAAFINNTSENQFTFYNSIYEASADTCISGASIFSSIMKGTCINNTIFIELCDCSHKIVELNENFCVVAIYDKLSDAVKRSGISANSICYMLRKYKDIAPERITDKTFMKLNSYIKIFANYYEN